MNGGAAAITIDNAGQMLKADAKRAIEGLANANINSFQITFTAKVFEDSYLKERHLPAINENLGRPLLRAINILEPVKSIYEINSIMELQSLCSDFHLFENPGAAIHRLTALLDCSATLVNSPNQIIVNNDIYDVASKYEYIELNLLSTQFIKLEAMRKGEILVKNNGR